ncbi:MAG TPA: cobyrinate a,c-diamide synthase [Clostridiales bacterium]|nr:cobyrinate a,c-diamide synthase [Clostridiales bacterium]
MGLPRIMIGGVSSGSGKTLVTCGILRAFLNRGYRVASFKCGPDYIDPMFHSEIIGAKSRNLDTFFCDGETVKYLFARTAKTADISVMEGVMGYYDGLKGTSTHASSYELAKITDTPVILVLNCKGMSLSVIPVIKGFLEYKKDSGIVGVILNQMPQKLYAGMKEAVEEELPVKVLGYVPFIRDMVIESRHLGLVTPEKVDNLQGKLDELAKVFEETLELDEIWSIATGAKELGYQKPEIPRVEGNPVIAVAKDEAFCFYYQDNLELLKDMGATLVEFSPLHDQELPVGIHGLILGGGYPELAAEQLSGNKSMIRSMKEKLLAGLPCIAECGGFMYLHETMEDMEKKRYPMVGAIAGEVYKTDRLNRFGYITLVSNTDQMLAAEGERIGAHEFHYFDSTSCGDSFTARKPLRDIQWKCIHGNGRLAAGFPHLYYYSNPRIPYGFLGSCLQYATR